MKKRLLTLFFPFVALIFEILPYGAVLNFANPDGEPFSQAYSYFDLTPFGYASFAPLITAALTCVTLFIAVLYIASGNKALGKAVTVISAAAFVISLMPIVFGAYSLVGGIITVTLAASACVSFFTR